MSKLFKNKVQNKHIELSIGDAYVKPLPLRLIPFAEKMDAGEGAEKILATMMIIKEVLVDENGEKFEDLEAMEQTEFESAFSIDDFTKILLAVMPSQDGPEGN